MGGHDAVPAGGPPERRLVRPPPRAPDGDPWLLHGPRQHGDIRSGQVLTAEGHRPPAPQRVQQGQRLIKPAGPGLGVAVFAECGELGRPRPKTRAEDQPSRRQHIQGDRLPRYLAHPPPGQHVHHDAELDPGGPGRHGRDHHHRVGDVPARIVPELVIPQKEPVPAVFLSRHGQFSEQQRVPERAHVGNPHRAARPPRHGTTLTGCQRAPSTTTARCDCATRCDKWRFRYLSGLDAGPGFGMKPQRPDVDRRRPAPPLPGRRQDP